MNSLQAKKLVSYYSKVTDKIPSSFVDVFQIYEDLKSDKYKQATETIQEKHRLGILEDFKTIDKASYQADKKNLLNAVVFAGCVNRSTKDNDFKHSQLVNLDIDENSKEDLDQFFDLVCAGNIKFIEAAARSVSGILNGSLWINAVVEIPSSFTYVDKELVKILNLSKDNFKEQLHTAYYKMIAYTLKEQLNINAGKSSDYKRVRYLSYDSNIYVNRAAAAERIRQEKLIKHLQSTQVEVKAFEQTTININESDAFKFAEAYAKAQNIEFTDGQKHLYLTNLSICLNLLGVTQQEAIEYITTKYNIDINSNCVSYPYQRYKEAAGVWAYKLAYKPQDSYHFTLKAGQKLDSLSKELLDIYKQESKVKDIVKIELKSGTSSGKTYFCAKTLAQELVKLNGCKTLIIFPLNSKTEKDANQYDLHYITGESKKKLGGQKAYLEALKQDVILVNQHALKMVVSSLLVSGHEQFNFIIDESHTLPAGMTENYKPEVISALWSCVEKYGITSTLLSGTPKDYFNVLGFKRIDVKQESRPAIKLIIREHLRNEVLTALHHIKKTDFSKNDKIVLVKIQSKKLIEDLKKMLLNAGFKQEEIECFYSSKEVRESEAYKKFIAAQAGQESFDGAVKIVLCTSFINEGIDIYSSKTIESISIERKYKLDVDDLVQFGDRHRTDKNKTLYVYVPKDRTEEDIAALEALKDRTEQQEEELERLTARQKCKNKAFNPAFEFKQLVKEFEAEAAYKNRTIHKAYLFASNTAKSSLKSSFAVDSKYLSYNSDKQLLEVNYIALMNKVESARFECTFVDNALEEIQEKFDYFSIDDQRHITSDTVNKQDIEDLAAIKKDEKEQRKAAQDKLRTMFIDAEETFIQAVCQQTEDVQLKNSINFDENLKQDVIDLLEDNTEIIEHIEDAERLVRTYHSFKKRLLSKDQFLQLFFKVDAGQYSFVHSEVIRLFLDDLAIHTSILLRDRTKHSWKKSQVINDLTVLQLADAKRYQEAFYRLQSALEKHGNKLRNKQIFDTLKPTKLIDNSQRKAVKLLNIFFKTDRSDGQYIVKEARTLQDVFLDAGLDINELNKY